MSGRRGWGWLRVGLGAGLLAVVLCAAVLLAGGARAEAGRQEIAPGRTLPYEAGNYCMGCHTAADVQALGGYGWDGGIERAALTECPAVKRIQEEQYYTERLLLGIERQRALLPDNARTQAVDVKLAAAMQSYSRLLDEEYPSLDAYVAQAQALRFRLGKLNTELKQIDEQRKQQNVLLWAIVVSLAILGLLGWGWWNARKGAPGPSRRLRWGTYLVSGLLLALIFLFFALPLFEQPAAGAVETTAEAQALQSELDTSSRAAIAAERATARAAMLAQVGAAWSELDPQKGAEALQAAVEADRLAREDAFALWGRANAAQEAAVGDLAKREQAGLIASKLGAVRERAWGLRAAGEAWETLETRTIPDNGSQTAELLDQAEAVVMGNPTLYDDLDRRSLTEAWTEVDVRRASRLAEEMDDPALQAWAWRKIASGASDSGMLLYAIRAARQIEDPWQRARSLTAIIWQRPDQDLVPETRKALDDATAAGIDPAQVMLARADLAVGARAYDLADNISTDFPAAQTRAWLGLNEYSRAWQAAGLITDPYERGRAQEAIVARWMWEDAAAAVQAAGEIDAPVLRDRALRKIIQNTGDASLVSQIENQYDRTLALTSVGDLKGAAALANDLKEQGPLVSAVDALAESDPAAALALAEQIRSETERAEAFRRLAVQTGDPAIFERALGLALAARVRGDALAPARASLALAQAMLPVDPALAAKAFQQAYEAALAISIK